jgi:hypothetical protein
VQRSCSVQLNYTNVCPLNPTTIYYYYYYYYLTAIGLTPGGGSTHLHTNSTQNTEKGTNKTVTKKNKIKNTRNESEGKILFPDPYLRI